MVSRNPSFTSSKKIFERRRCSALYLMKFMSLGEVAIFKPLSEACLEMKLELKEGREELMNFSSKNVPEILEESLRIEAKLQEVAEAWEAEEILIKGISSLAELEELVLAHKKFYDFLLFLLHNYYPIESIALSASKILKEAENREWNIDLRRMIDAIEFVELLNKERQLREGIKECFKNSQLFPLRVIPHKFAE